MECVKKKREISTYLSFVDENLLEKSRLQSHRLNSSECLFLFFLLCRDVSSLGKVSVSLFHLRSDPG